MVQIGVAVLVALAGALFPVISVEAYLVGASAVNDGAALAGIVVVTATVQPLGKLAYYAMGRGVLNVRWLRPKQPGKWSARMSRIREQAEHRPVWTAGVLLASSAVSLPPYLLMCVLAGTVRMNVVWFLVVSIVGRLARFGVVAFLPGWTLGLFG